MATTLRIKTRVSGVAGAPATLATGELAYNMIDGTIYVGYGDNGSGVATSVKSVAKDNFALNLPAGTNGKILGFTGGVPVWQDAPVGSVYSADGNGIELTGSTFSLNFTEIATGISLSSYAPLASPALTGTPTAPTAVNTTNTTQLATTAFVQGRINDILNGAGAAYDTLKELQDLIVSDESTASALATTVSGKLTASSNLSDVANATTARSNLGLGSMATQAASAVAITGGTISGVTITSVTLDGGTF